jgi:pyruvate formate lyase activating enzyme
MSNVRALDDYKGIVFNVQRYSLHDGAGIRTTVFLKGCPLVCKWCANPESQKMYPEILIRKVNCIGCGACVNACPNHALTLAEDKIVLDRSLCERCGACTQVCNSNAITMVGREVTVGELYKEIIEDKIFFDTSGGGVTFSGGEPFMQPEFLKAILMKCKENNIHTAVETCGQVSEKVIVEILPYVDHFFYDIKIMDAQKHKEYTGVTNEIILANLATIVSHKKEVLVRTPLIPGVNDDEENIRKMGQFLESIGIKTMQILPYHAYGVAKYEAIGQTYQLNAAPPTQQIKDAVVAILAEYGVSTIV